MNALETWENILLHDIKCRLAGEEYRTLQDDGKPQMLEDIKLLLEVIETHLENK